MDIHWERLVEAMGEPAWARYADVFRRPRPHRQLDRAADQLIEWTMTLSGDELYGLAETVPSFPIFPFYSIRKLVESEHVRARRSVVDIEIGNRRARMPARPFHDAGDAVGFAPPGAAARRAYRCGPRRTAGVPA